ncbi:hypothetical protein N2599_32830 (plasmid) [Rhizobium sullae]|uniref:MFS transporter n=1 Tax=Rhizobium sullae TaxID=50338 RepID=A0ABY5XSC4_RHISU|nr:hypothetical protein [Rhizobium sullae]UWU17520.1 hypothetical protein N2599_32830 [Rhizobium sullae]
MAGYSDNNLELKTQDYECDVKERARGRTEWNTAFSPQTDVLGLAQTCQQVASVAGIIAGVVATQLFGLEVAFPLVASLYGLSFLGALGLWLKSRRSSG